MTGTLRMSGQAYSRETGGAADSRMWISRGLLGACLLFRIKALGSVVLRPAPSSALIGLRVFSGPLPLTARGEPGWKARLQGWAGHLARWSEYSTCPRFRFCFVPFLGADFVLAREIHGGEQRPGCGVVQWVAAGIPLRLLLGAVLG